MKKIFFLTLVLFEISIQSQITTFQINNYSSYYLYGRFGAYGISNNCFPAVNAPVDGDHIVPPNIVNVNYNYYNSSTSIVPINNWWVQTSPTSPGGIRASTHPSLSHYGAISMNTDWVYYWFQTKDASLNPYDDFQMGVVTCGWTSNNTYFAGSYAEAEWFTIGGYTYVQVYDL